jgi:hypothetical protein
VIRAVPAGRTAVVALPRAPLVHRQAGLPGLHTARRPGSLQCPSPLPAAPLPLQPPGQRLQPPATAPLAAGHAAAQLHPQRWQLHPPPCRARAAAASRAPDEQSRHPQLQRRRLGPPAAVRPPPLAVHRAVLRPRWCRCHWACWHDGPPQAQLAAGPRQPELPPPRPATGVRVPRLALPPAAARAVLRRLQRPQGQHLPGAAGEHSGAPAAPGEVTPPRLRAPRAASPSRPPHPVTSPPPVRGDSAAGMA